MIKLKKKLTKLEDICAKYDQNRQQVISDVKL